MMCYPSDTDWGCAFSAADIEAMRADAAKSANMDRAEALAWGSLAKLTAYQIGVCPVTVRPCTAGCYGAGTWMSGVVAGSGSGALPIRSIGSFTPHVSGGQWLNSCGCASAGDCACGSIEEIVLPGPVGAIESVMIDGSVIDPTRYRVDNGNRLVSVDPTLTWPKCQDMSVAADADGAFSVTYYQGAAPNDLTRYAAGLLAVEFYKACSGNGKSCSLPTGVTSVVRRGVTFDLEAGLFPNGLTGIKQTDAVIQMYNPHGLTAPPRVISPVSARGPRRQTWGR